MERRFTDKLEALNFAKSESIKAEIILYVIESERDFYVTDNRITNYFESIIYKVENGGIIK